MTAPRMTDARLDRIREMVTEGVLDDHVGTVAEVLEELRLTRAEVQRYRSRCPVTAEDVEVAGVTYEQACAYVESLDAWAEVEARNGRRWAAGTWRTLLLRAQDFAGHAADAVSAIALQAARPAFDILDEMAAMAEEPSP